MMIKRLRSIALLLAVGIALVWCSQAMAYIVPTENSRIKYFYVFGQDGDPLVGAEDHELELFIDVPAAEANDVEIRVYDPDIGLNIDWKKPNNEWDTSTEFAVYGEELLDKQVFGQGREYDKAYYTFGPYSKTKGEKIGNFYRFRLVVTGLEGDDQNLFRVDIRPNSAESFVQNITFRLLPYEGDKMYFYPEIPAGTEYIVVENYDLDVDGGSSEIGATLTSKKYDVNDSASGEWTETNIPVKTDVAARMIYIITKKTQKHANAGVKIMDDKGNLIPLYFRKGAPVAVKIPAAKPKKEAPKITKAPKCNKFTFDATESYDIDKQKLSYLWDFGDGQTSTEPVVTHIYEKGGDYTVTLTVTDNSGLPCNSATTTQRVTVNTAPQAAFDGPDRVCAGTAVTFDASATQDNTMDNLSYMWDFGDGEKGTGKVVSHTYAKGGKYPVRLTVDDNSNTPCNLDSVQKMIQVNTAPTADAGDDISLCLKSLDQDYSVVLDGSGSKDPDGDTLTYMWDLGDGNTAEGKKVTHVYTTSGTYTATLRVDDGSGLPCSTDSDSVNIKLNKAPVANAGSDKKTCVGDEIDFDASASKTEPGESLSYKWDFGDGQTAAGEKVQHTYAKGGTYKAALTVDDGKGTECSASSDAVSVVVNAAPTVMLEDVKNTCVGMKVNFDASGSADPDGDSLSYMWDFGDGTTAKGSSKQTHTYEKGGYYTVTVKVDDGKGSPCSTASDQTGVKVNTPPQAMMKMPDRCCVGTEQEFDASGSKDADGDSLSYMWDFGDGNTSEGQTVTHIYTKPGTYTVMLKVNDNSGTECSTDSTSGKSVVNAKPVPVIKVR